MKLPEDLNASDKDQEPMLDTISRNKAAFMMVIGLVAILIVSGGALAYAFGGSDSDSSDDPPGVAVMPIVTPTPTVATATPTVAIATPDAATATQTAQVALSATATAVPPTNTPIPPTSTPDDDMARLGDSQEPDSELYGAIFNITVVAYNDNYSGATLRPASEGGRLVAAEVFYENISGTPQDYNLLFWHVQDAAAFVYDVPLLKQVLDDTGLGSGSLPAGGKVRGVVVWEVPQDAVVELVIYGRIGFDPTPWAIR